MVIPSNVMRNKERRDKMKKESLFIIIAFITLLVGCSDNSKVKYAQSLSNNEEYEVILMGGQSNMVGQGIQSDLQKMTFENISYFDFGLSPNLKNPRDNFGPEVGVAMELRSNFPNKKFILIKYAIGGASLLDWSPNYSKQKAEVT